MPGPSAGTGTVMTTDESATGDDVPTDTATAAESRSTGDSDPDAGPDAPQDRHSSTGTTSNDTPVGRVSGE
jgi:hypothetical protein